MPVSQQQKTVNRSIMTRGMTQHRSINRSFFCGRKKRQCKSDETTNSVTEFRADAKTRWRSRHFLLNESRRDGRRRNPQIFPPPSARKHVPLSQQPASRPPPTAKNPTYRRITHIDNNYATTTWPRKGRPSLAIGHNWVNWRKYLALFAAPPPGTNWKQLRISIAIISAT